MLCIIFLVLWCADSAVLLFLNYVSTSLMHTPKHRFGWSNCHPGSSRMLRRWRQQSWWGRGGWCCRVAIASSWESCGWGAACIEWNACNQQRCFLCWEKVQDLDFIWTRKANGSLVALKDMSKPTSAVVSIGIQLVGRGKPKTVYINLPVQFEVATGHPFSQAQWTIMLTMNTVHTPDQTS